ncbi:glycosyl transferase [Thioclava sp. SK-1]|nr:glycosyl transferase [Thioclava sp. SK-1]
MVGVVIPANNEADYIDACLQALLDQVSVPMMRIVVSANGCSDTTVDQVRAFEARFEAAGHVLICLDSPEGGKLAALDRAEAALEPHMARIFLDADVICDPQLIGQVARALDTDQPRYATGTLQVTRARSGFTRAYARFWQRLPFVESGAVGAGFFAVNPAGRARWDAFPKIISDDTFVRLCFTPSERIEVPACYHWPMIEGFRPMVKVRKRQDAGVEEIARLWPHMLENEGKHSLTRKRILELAATMPAGFAAYMAVHLAVRIGPKTTSWSRGR